MTVDISVQPEDIGLARMIDRSKSPKVVGPLPEM